MDSHYLFNYENEVIFTVIDRNTIEVTYIAAGNEVEKTRMWVVKAREEYRKFVDLGYSTTPNYDYLEDDPDAKYEYFLETRWSPAMEAEELMERRAAMGLWN